MSLNINDVITGMYANSIPKQGSILESTNRTEDDNNLDMNSYLLMFVEQLKNQDPLNPMDTSDMMNQFVQMATVEAITTMVDVTKTSYAASLVGKDVTIAKEGSNGEIEQLYGTVTGSGSYDGEQVIFVNDEAFYVSQVMAVGKVPERQEEVEDTTEK